jgi:hypothetical protein
MAASATLALKAGVWFRRGLLLMISPVRGYHRRYQAETPLIGLFKFASPALTSVPIWLISADRNICSILFEFAAANLFQRHAESRSCIFLGTMQPYDVIGPRTNLIRFELKRG